MHRLWTLSMLSAVKWGQEITMEYKKGEKANTVMSLTFEGAEPANATASEDEVAE